MPKLLCDVFSHMKSKEQYGKAGDHVTIISQRGDVLIVENAKGNRFSVNVKKVVDETVPPSKVEAPAVKPIAPLVKKVKESVSQTNLF